MSLMQKAGQYAENKYWLKGSGLLDQLACAVGGMITIDFADIENPAIREIKCDFDEMSMIWLSSTPERSCRFECRVFCSSE